MGDIQQHDEFFLNGVRYYTQEQLDAAVAEAEQRGYLNGYREGRGFDLGDPSKKRDYDMGYEQGQRDARRETWPESMAAAEMRAIAKAVAAVEGQAAAFLAEDDRVGHDVMQYVIAAIKAVGGE